MSDPIIECPSCGKTYRWQAKIAGKQVRCVCSQKFRVPGTPGGVPIAEVQTPVEPANPVELADSADGPVGNPYELDLPGDRPVEASAEPDPYDLDLPEDEPVTPPPAAIATGNMAAAVTPASGGGKCPSCNSPMRPGAVICMNCGFNSAEGAKIQTQVAQDTEEDGFEPEPQIPAETDERANRVANRYKYDDEVAADIAKRHHFQEKTLPLIMIAAGVLLLLFNAVVMAPAANAAADWLGVGTDSRWAIALVYVIISGVLLLVQIPCLLVGLIMCAKLFGSGFGDLFSVLKKLLALALLAGSFFNLVDLSINILLSGFGRAGWPLTFSVSLVFFWTVISKLFDELEYMEVLMLFVAMLLVPRLILWVIALFLMM